jgi:hypothetical protein
MILLLLAIASLLSANLDHRTWDDAAFAQESSFR